MSEVCEHQNLDFEPEDRSVGIFGCSVWCDDCGVVALDYRELWEPGEAGGFIGFYVTRWEPKHWQKGDLFMLMERGEPAGPFTVYQIDGARTDEHVIGRSRSGLFEVHRDSMLPVKDESGA